MNRTRTKVRKLSVEDLGVPVEVAGADGADLSTDITGDSEYAVLPESNEILQKVRQALSMGFAGVILSGPPGTGKSWYAKRIAGTLAVDQHAIRIVQFHSSYQYEDFIEGFVPTPPVGFRSEKKVFSQICKAASLRPGDHVLIIDEFSRCDVARVFGEALTYIEQDKRGQQFTLSSGSDLTVPPNLILLCTMNPWDKGVDELDVALERRFAQIDLLPDSLTLQNILSDKGADPEFVQKVVRFFEWVQRLDDETLRIGHAYFLGCLDQNRAELAWEFRLFPFFRKACRLDSATLDMIKREWSKVVPWNAPEGAAVTGDVEAEAETIEGEPLSPGR